MFHIPLRPFNVFLYLYCFKEMNTLNSLPIHIYFTPPWWTQLIARHMCKSSMHGLISGRPFNDIATHARGYLVGLHQICDSTDLASNERFLMRCICKDVFCWLTGGDEHQKHQHQRVVWIGRADSSVVSSRSGYQLPHLDTSIISVHECTNVFV